MNFSLKRLVTESRARADTCDGVFEVLTSSEGRWFAGCCALALDANVAMAVPTASDFVLRESLCDHIEASFFSQFETTLHSPLAVHLP